MEYHFEGALTTRDSKRYIYHPFWVPEGTGEVNICFHFVPHEVQGSKNFLTLAVFDPTGFRGAGLRESSMEAVVINSVDASPGYLSGPLQPGQWVAQIDAYLIMPGQPVHYQLHIRLTDSTNTHRRSARPRRISRPNPHNIGRRGPGWYRGDLHAHSHHSDGDRFAVADLVHTAQLYGLDFVFLTDHNTFAGLREMEALTTPEILTCGGIELTTFWGHAVCLGAREWLDWRIQPGTGEMARLIATCESNAHVVVIAHPLAIGDPVCTGCTWRFWDTMPGTAHCVEIWNGTWESIFSNNEAALSLWYDWLNMGVRISATAGTDIHSAHDYASQPGFNVVYAAELSEAALLQALRAGRLYLSSGPQLRFWAEGANGEQWMIGDTVDQTATFCIAWSGCSEDSRIRLMVNGRLRKEWVVQPEGTIYHDLSPAEADWAVVEARDGQGRLVAITNPIFLNGAQRTAPMVGVAESAGIRRV